MTDPDWKIDQPEQTSLVLDTMRLASALDAVTAGDLPDSIAEALRRGYLGLADLLIRRDSSILKEKDAMIIDWTLDMVAARLRFLRTVQRRNLPN